MLESIPKGVRSLIFIYCITDTLKFKNLVFAHLKSEINNFKSENLTSEINNPIFYLIDKFFLLIINTVN